MLLFGRAGPPLLGRRVQAFCRSRACCSLMPWVFLSFSTKIWGKMWEIWGTNGKIMGKILENTEFYLIKRTHNGQRFIATPYKSDWFAWSLLGKQKWDESDGRRRRLTLPYIAKDFTCKLKMISSVSPSFFTRGSNVFMFHCSFKVFPI